MDGSRRVTERVLRSLRQPQTMSWPDRSDPPCAAIARIILVAIGGRDETARANLNPAANAAVWPKLRKRNHHARVRGLEIAIRRKLVGAAVVDQNELMRTSPRLQRVGELAIEIGDVLGFVRSE